MVDKCVNEIVEATGKLLGSKEAKEILAEITRQVEASGKTIEQINLELADSVALQVKNVQVNKVNALKQRIKVQENAKFFVDRIKEIPQGKGGFLGTTLGTAEGVFRDSVNFFTDKIEKVKQTEIFNLNSKYFTLVREAGLDIKNIKEADSNKVAEFVAEMAQDQKGVFRDLRSLAPELQDDYKLAKTIFHMNEHIRQYKNALGEPTEFLQGRIGKQSWNAVKIAGREAKFKQDFKLALDLERMGLSVAGNIQEGIDPLLTDAGLEALADKLVKEVISGRFTDDLDLDKFNIDDLFKPITSGKAGDAALKYPKAKNRKIHLKPESWNSLMSEYGSGNVFEALMKDISSTASKAAFIKELGPDPKAAWEKTFSLIADNTKQYGKGGAHFADPTNANGIVKKRYDALTGLWDRPLNADGALIANVNDTTRRSVGVSSLGGSLFSSVPDLATPGLRRAVLAINPNENSIVVQLSSLTDNLKMLFDVFGDVEGKRISDLMLEELKTNYWDLISDTRFSESFTDSLYQASIGKVTKTDDGLRVLAGADDLQGLSLGEGVKAVNNAEFLAKAKTSANKGLDGITNFFNILAKTNLTEVWTNRRVANTYTSIARDLGSLADTSYANLAKHNKDWLKELGIDKVWDTLRTKVTIADNGRAYIAPDAMKNLTDAELDLISSAYLVSKDIAADQADLALKAAFGTESNKRVLRPGASTKSKLQVFAANRGTFLGEANRYYAQFKSYPMELVFNNIVPALNKGKVGTVGSFIAIGMALTMVSKTIKDVAANRTPRSINILSSDEEEQAAAWDYVTDLFLSTAGVPFAAEVFRATKSAASGNSRAGDQLLGDVAGVFAGPTGGAIVNIGQNTVATGFAVAEGEDLPKKVLKDTTEFAKRGLGLTSSIATPILNGYLLPSIYTLFDPDYIERMEDIAERQGSELIVDQ
jgi:hypothetical protein